MAHIDTLALMSIALKTGAQVTEASDSILTSRLMSYAGLMIFPYVFYVFEASAASLTSALIPFSMLPYFSA